MNLPGHVGAVPAERRTGGLRAAERARRTRRRVLHRRAETGVGCRV